MVNKMTQLCEFAIDKSIGLSVNVICSKTQEFCGMIRYCSMERRPVMNSNYFKYGCKLKQQKGVCMAKKRKSIEERHYSYSDETILPINYGNSIRAYDIDTSDLEKTMMCKVNYTKNGKTSLQYPLEGHYYNIMVNGTYSGNVEITYKGSLCEKNIVNIKEV